MCAVVVSHAERATISACVCCARQINQHGGGARSMMIFKIHSRHTEKRTTGADDRDILSFPSHTSSGVANTLYGNGPLTVYLCTYCQPYVSLWDARTYAYIVELTVRKRNREELYTGKQIKNVEQNVFIWRSVFEKIKFENLPSILELDLF